MQEVLVHPTLFCFGFSLSSMAAARFPEVFFTMVVVVLAKNGEVVWALWKAMGAGVARKEKARASGGGR